MNTVAVWLPDGASVLMLLQREIVWQIVSGRSNGEIAERLGLTAGTVGMHVGRIVARFGLQRRAGIAPWAPERGVVL
jgi:DNA-binding CsgD family transcriptional regulator